MPSHDAANTEGMETFCHETGTTESHITNTIDSAINIHLTKAQHWCQKLVTVKKTGLCFGILCLGPFFSLLLYMERLQKCLHAHYKIPEFRHTLLTGMNIQGSDAGKDRQKTFPRDKLT